MTVSLSSGCCCLPQFGNSNIVFFQGNSCAFRKVIGVGKRCRAVIKSAPPPFLPRKMMWTHIRLSQHLAWEFYELLQIFKRFQMALKCVFRKTSGGGAERMYFIIKRQVLSKTSPRNEFISWRLKAKRKLESFHLKWKKLLNWQSENSE